MLGTIFPVGALVLLVLELRVQALMFVAIAIPNAITEIFEDRLNCILVALNKNDNHYHNTLG